MNFPTRNTDADQSWNKNHIARFVNCEICCDGKERIQARSSNSIPIRTFFQVNFHKAINAVSFRMIIIGFYQTVGFHKARALHQTAAKIGTTKSLQDSADRTDQRSLIFNSTFTEIDMNGGLIIDSRMQC
ncbi:hypothetical protein D3C72_1810790 [compost metagenome]